MNLLQFLSVARFKIKSDEGYKEKQKCPRYKWTRLSIAYTSEFGLNVLKWNLVQQIPIIKDTFGQPLIIHYMKVPLNWIWAEQYQVKKRSIFTLLFPSSPRTYLLSDSSSMCFQNMVLSIQFVSLYLFRLVSQIILLFTLMSRFVIPYIHVTH